jgi:Lipocalin-like domain
MKQVWQVFGCVLLIANSQSNAQQRESCAGAPQLGTWALQSWVSEDIETGQKTSPFGDHPSGYLSYGPDCRMYVILTKQDRKAPASALVPTDAEKVDLYGGLVAYAGSYTIDGDKVSHHIDASWNQAWSGTTQVRQFKIDGNTLHLRSLPAKSPVTGKQGVFVLDWSKVH